MCLVGRFISRTWNPAISILVVIYLFRGEKFTGHRPLSHQNMKRVSLSNLLLIVCFGFLLNASVGKLKHQEGKIL